MNPLLKKIFYFPITRIVLGIISCFAILIAVQNFISKPIFYGLLSSKELADTCINYTSVIVLLTTYFLLFRFYEQRKINELSAAYAPKELIGGLFLGFSILSLVILILYVLGNYHIIEFTGFSYFLAPLSFLVIAALIEEVFFSNNFI